MSIYSGEYTTRSYTIGSLFSTNYSPVFMQKLLYKRPEAVLPLRLQVILIPADIIKPMVNIPLQRWPSHVIYTSTITKTKHHALP